MKKNKTSKIVMTELLLALSVSSLMGIGFSTWNATAANSFETDGFQANVADVNVRGAGNVDVFSNLAITSIFSFSRYGFDVNGEYKTSGAVVGGSAKFLPSVAKTAISSLNAEGKVGIKASLIGEPSLEEYGISAISGKINNNSCSIGSYYNGEIPISYVLTNIDPSETNIFIFFEFTLEWNSTTTCSDFETFYTSFSAEGAGFKIKLEAYEAVI